MVICFLNYVLRIKKIPVLFQFTKILSLSVFVMTTLNWIHHLGFKLKTLHIIHLISVVQLKSINFLNELILLMKHVLFSTGVPFPKNYYPTVKKILTRLYRVFVHVYIHHFEKLVMMGAVSHL